VATRTTAIAMKNVKRYMSALSFDFALANIVCAVGVRKVTMRISLEGRWCHNG